MSRLLAAGLVLFAVAAFVGFDSWSKLAWPHVHGTVVGVHPKCEMKSEQYNVLTRTTSTATVDCDDVETFKILHPDKEWEVRRSYLTHVKVDGAQPVATTLVIYSEPAPKRAEMLDLIQDPKDKLRVLIGAASANGFGAMGVALLVGGVLLVLWLVLRGRRKPPAVLPPDDAIPDPSPDVASPAPSRATGFATRPAAAGPRTFGRR